MRVFVVDITTISLLCFFAILLGVGAVIMVYRDLAIPADATIGGGTRRLRRVPDVFDETQASSLVGRFDQAFYRLVLESGYDGNPSSVYLMIVAISLAIGGTIWIVTDQPILGFVGVVFTGIVSSLVVVLRRERRRRQVLTQLPHAIDTLARAVHAGESLEQAIMLVGEVMKAPLGGEFVRCSDQLRMGRSMAAAMRALANRNRLVEMRVLASTLTVHRATGGNVSRTLERLAGTVRDRIDSRRQMRATTGAGRASAILIAALGPLAYLAILMLQPDHVGVLLEDSLGRIMLGAAVVLEIVGIIWVALLLRTE
jgi:tight adherence protein B